MNTTLLCILVFAVVMLPVAIAGFAHRERGSVAASKSLVARIAEGPLGVLLMRLRRGSIEKVRAQLTEAGRGRAANVAEIFVAQALDAALFALGALALGTLLPEDAKALSPVLAVLGFFVGWAMPSTALANDVQARKRDLVRALPFAIDLLVSAMRSGLDFGAAVRYYVNLGDNGPLTEEFAAMLRENELGTGRITALQNMADRVRIPSFSTFVSAVALGTEMGSPLSDTMEVQGEELRKTRYSQAEILAQKAPSKMIFPMAVFVMPAVFVIIFVPIYLRMRTAKG